MFAILSGSFELRWWILQRCNGAQPSFQALRSFSSMGRWFWYKQSRDGYKTNRLLSIYCLYLIIGFNPMFDLFLWRYCNSSLVPVPMPSQDWWLTAHRTVFCQISRLDAIHQGQWGGRSGRYFQNVVLAELLQSCESLIWSSLVLTVIYDWV